MELFVFLDLDDTIFQTKRKCPPDTVITPAAFAQDGSPMSFFTPKQQRFFNLLSSKTRLIPTTARDSHAFGRAKIPQYDYAIINHGGLILNADGSCHQDWFNHIKQLLSEFTDDLHRLEKFLHEATAAWGSPFKIRLISDLGLTFYCLVKHKQRDISQRNCYSLSLLLTQIIEPYLKSQQLNYYCHLNDNNLAILPHFLNKAPAVSILQQQLTQQYQDYLSFGMGDSLTDMAYMQLCDYFITPKNSQIVRERINLPSSFRPIEV